MNNSKNVGFDVDAMDVIALKGMIKILLRLSSKDHEMMQNIEQRLRAIEVDRQKKVDELTALFGTPGELRAVDELTELTEYQKDFICFQIGEWYLKWKGNITTVPGVGHRLGVAKEELKAMICGYELNSRDCEHESDGINHSFVDTDSSISFKMNKCKKCAQFYSEKE